ncbi:MAG: aldehyde dehydrogenase family protein [Anaerolineae bacterium]|nr:aldehyde dehydrogenase family protein [Anaerolineae bacterium]MDQ7035619.1 aldehyde dehydrogenase family protein [Anaerolineae bacterium]
MTTDRKHIKVTYSSLGSPDPLLHDYYEEDVTTARANLGGTYPMYINGEWRDGEKTFAKYSPIDTNLVIGHFSHGSRQDVDDAVAAAKAAYPTWRDTPWLERLSYLRRVADLISERLFQMAAVVSLEVGKNRLEAIGEVEETADLIRYCIQAMEENDGFIKQLASETEKHHNRSVLKPYGVWGVISPFNFPCALSGGPAGAALIAGNTVVHKPADDAPLTAVLLAQCFHDAGLPPGVYNMVTGGDEPGKALVANNDIDGITFTGSYDVGMSILRKFSTQTGYMRPVIAEMGGKNPVIITKNANLEKAAYGVMRSAFGLTGQKCSACSRVYVDNEVKEVFTQILVDITEKIKVGDPTERETFMGPIINGTAYRAYRRYARELADQGDVLTGGTTLEIGDGYYVAPTVVDNLPDNHALWTEEMFAPIVVLGGYDDIDEAMKKANHIDLGLTAGFYSEDKAEIDWFLSHIEAGVVYVNRESGATTGAWPGYQAFGGWKGSTGSGKAAGSYYYLQQYMREQSHTIVD